MAKKKTWWLVAALGAAAAAVAYFLWPKKFKVRIASEPGGATVQIFRLRGGRVVGDDLFVGRTPVMVTLEFDPGHKIGVQVSLPEFELKIIEFEMVDNPPGIITSEGKRIPLVLGEDVKDADVPTVVSVTLAKVNAN